MVKVNLVAAATLCRSGRFGAHCRLPAGCGRANRNCSGRAAAGRAAQPDPDPGLEHNVADRRHQPMGDPRLHPPGRQRLHVGAADVLRHFRRQGHSLAGRQHGIHQRRLHLAADQAQPGRQVERRHAGHLEGRGLHLRRPDEERQAAVPRGLRAVRRVRSLRSTT